MTSSARFAAGIYRPEELPESAGARVRALLFNAAMRPGTPWVRRVDEKSARLAASSLMVPLEVHIADLWSAAAVDHQIVEGDRLVTRFNDLRVDHGSVRRGLLSNDFQPLARVLVEPLGINRRDVALEGLQNLPALWLR